MSSHVFTVRRRWLFVLFLVSLHLVLAAGPDSVIGRWLFLSHIGLGLLWQPFIQPHRRLGLEGSVLVLGSAALLALFLDWTLLSIWTLLLAGVVGGKVFMFPDRWERVFHLLALGYLTMTVLLWIPPLAVGLSEPALAALVLYTAPLAFIAMLMLPTRQTEAEARAEIVDFVYGVFVVLLLAVIVLGSLSFSLLSHSSYLESMLVTLAVVAATLLLLGFIWNPRAGFSGLGAAVAQHVMSLGLPVEEWLRSLAELGRREEDPHRFIAAACAELPQHLPGVLGGRWQVEGAAGEFGRLGGTVTVYRHGALTLELVTRVAPSPALRWHHDLIVRLLAEFYLGKWRAQELKRLSVVEAIHETGARLTHDVKNLLQSLETLCVAARETDAAGSARLVALLRDQLPAISARLRQTLDKLAAPQARAMAAAPCAARAWLDALVKRYAPVEPCFETDGDAPECWLEDAELFTSVAENLLQNAAHKRLREPGLHVRLHLACHEGAAELEVCDDGSAIAQELADRLLRERVPSEDGFGIGLYQCARLAEQRGYQLVLSENRPGHVCFRLARGGLKGQGAGARPSRR